MTTRGLQGRLQPDMTLTPERQAVLDLHNAGLTVRQIAKRLDISTQRVYAQFAKLGIPTGTRFPHSPSTESVPS